MSGNKLKLLTIPLAETSDEPLRETDLAYGIHIEHLPARVWFPKSQIQEFTQGDEIVSFWCPIWLIEEKALEVFIDTSYEPSLF